MPKPRHMRQRTGLWKNSASSRAASRRIQNYNIPANSTSVRRKTRGCSACCCTSGSQPRHRRRSGSRPRHRRSANRPRHRRSASRPRHRRSASRLDEKTARFVHVELRFLSCDTHLAEHGSKLHNKKMPKERRRQGAEILENFPGMILEARRRKLDPEVIQFGCTKCSRRLSRSARSAERWSK